MSGYLGAAILGDGRVALLLDPRVSRPRAAPAAGPRRQRLFSTGRAASPTLLVVEDSFMVRELQRSILEAAGYRVDTAKSGLDALDRLAANSEIDLVVTDVDMPEMDGLALTEAIRASAEWRSLPVIVVTSRASDEDRRRGVEVGADAYMVKDSFDQHALLETVARHGRRVTEATRPRVLICEDSRTYAAALQRVIEHDGQLEVVAVARSAEDAIASVGRLAPDLVTMDIELPGHVRPRGGRAHHGHCPRADPRALGARRPRLEVGGRGARRRRARRAARRARSICSIRADPERARSAGASRS